MEDAVAAQPLGRAGDLAAVHQYVVAAAGGGGEPQLAQRLHDAALVEHAAVLGVFQRLLGAKLRVELLDLPGALQAALVPPPAHDVAVAAQRRALQIGPVGQQVHPVVPLVVVARQLGGRDEPHTVLHGVIVSILRAAQRIVVRQGHGVQPRPRRQDGQAVNGHRAVGTGGMVV